MDLNLQPENIISGHSFSFDSGVATLCGVNAALVYAHICFWIKQNSQREDCWHEDKAWMYQSQDQIAKHFEFMSRDQVQRSIDILIKKGILIKGNFNIRALDKVTWYSVPDEIFKKLVTIVRNRTVDCANSHNALRAGAQCIYSNTIKKNINERNVEDVGPVDNSNPREVIPPKTKNVQNRRPKFSNREVPEFLEKVKLSTQDRQLLANQFSDSELIRAIEDAKSFWKTIEPIKNMAAFLTDRCKEYKIKESNLMSMV